MRSFLYRLFCHYVAMVDIQHTHTYLMLCFREKFVLLLHHISLENASQENKLITSSSHYGINAAVRLLFISFKKNGVNLFLCFYIFRGFIMLSRSSITLSPTLWHTHVLTIFISYIKDIFKTFYCKRQFW